MRRSVPLASSFMLLVVLTSTGCHGAQPPDALTRAAFEGRTAEVMAALARGDGDACDALVWASRGGQPDPILAITGRGVNPDACRVGVNDWTPLMHAIHKDQAAAVDALIRAGANVNATAPHAFTPLMMAVGNGNATIVSMLLAAGADPHATAPNGASVLSVALTGGALSDIERPLLGACHPEIVKALVTRAPDLRLQPSLRTRVSRAIARLNGCEEAIALASR